MVIRACLYCKKVLYEHEDGRTRMTGFHDIHVMGELTGLKDVFVDEEMKAAIVL